MANPLLGHWNLVENINLEALMKKLGVGYLTRKLGLTLKPSVDISSQGDAYTITTTSSLKTHVTSFELNKKFDEVTLYDTKVNSIVTMEGGKMIHKQTDTNGLLCVIVREVNDKGQQIVTITADDVTATRSYNKTV